MMQEYIIPEGPYRSTLFSTFGREWQRPIIDVIDSEKYHSILICAVPRLGKSTLANAYLLWRLFEYGESTQLLLPTQVLANSFFKDKLESSISENPRLAKHLPSTYIQGGTLKHIIRYNNGAVLRNIYSSNQIRSYDSQTLVVSEAAQFASVAGNESDIITLAIKRQADHKHHGLVFMESTPTVDTARFHREIKLGTDSHLEVACPFCGKYFEAGKRAYFFMNESETENESELNPYIKCPSCEKHIEEKHREEMQNTVKIIHKNDNATSFSISIDWFFAKLTMNDLAIAEFRNKHNQTIDSVRNLYQNFYAMPTNEKIEQPEKVINGISKEQILERAGAFESGVIPDKVKFIVGSVDIQKCWLYWLIVGFDENMTGHIIDYSVVDIVPLEMQGSVQPTPQMLVNSLNTAYSELQKYNPVSIWVDTSYKHEASEIPIIRNWASSYTNVFSIAGRSHTEFVRIDKQSNQIPAQCRDFMMPKVQEGSAQILWFLDVDRIKSMLRDKISMPINAQGGFVFPKNIMEKGRNWLIQHFTTEEPKLVASKFGMKTITWIKQGKRRCDLFDCCVYAMAGGMLYAGINNIKGAVVMPAKQRLEIKRKPIQNKLIDNKQINNKIVNKQYNQNRKVYNRKQPRGF
jgi:phage terminase large subunit GpA-like protein